MIRGGCGKDQQAGQQTMRENVQHVAPLIVLWRWFSTGVRPGAPDGLPKEASGKVSA